MALKTFKPYTKSTRGTVVLDKSPLWKGAPYGKRGVTNAVDDFIRENLLFKERCGETQFVITV